MANVTGLLPSPTFGLRNVVWNPLECVVLFFFVGKNFMENAIDIFGARVGLSLCDRWKKTIFFFFNFLNTGQLSQVF